MLQLTTKSSSRIFLIEIEGALDSQNSQDFKNYILEKISEGYRVFGLDLAQMQYISSRGIAIILELQDEIERHYGGLALFHLSSEVRNLFDFLQISKRVKLFDQQKAAEYYLKEILMTDPDQQEDESPRVEESPLPTEEDLATSAEYAEDELNERKLREEVEARQKKQAEKKKADDRKLRMQPKPLVANEVHKPDHESIPMKEQGEQALEEMPREDKPLPSEETTESDSGKYAVYDILETGLPVAQSLGSPALEDGSRYVMCPNCESTLRVRKTGKHLCPACRSTFVFKF
jgi:anti-anti-sigma factor